MLVFNVFVRIAQFHGHSVVIRVNPLCMVRPHRDEYSSSRPYTSVLFEPFKMLYMILQGKMQAQCRNGNIDAKRTSHIGAVSRSSLSNAITVTRERRVKFKLFTFRAIQWPGGYLWKTIKIIAIFLIQTAISKITPQCQAQPAHH